MREFMDIIRPKLQEQEDVDTPPKPYKELPPWMHKGPFAPPREFENGVMFEADEEPEEEPKRQWKKDKKEKKHKKGGKKGKKDHKKKRSDKKHKKRHGCCFAPLVTIALFFGHIFQLRMLA
jgi:hypothetical protein